MVREGGDPGKSNPKNKQTALGTSKINYIEPRISTTWCQKYDMLLENIFTKTLRDKFKWA
ncbi:DNA topoisomerase 1 [Podila horticola]|nr:DNA topoisomerase 1 [Podila horticola]